MRVFIAGVDGYIGWALAQYLHGRGHVVGGADLLLRRRWVREVGSQSAIPIAPIAMRLRGFRSHYGVPLSFFRLDLRSYQHVEAAIREFRPDAVVHLGECPSAPYSMQSVAHATFVQTNNLQTTFNLMYAIKEYGRNVQLVKLGTMGEYGTPNVPIAEGFVRVRCEGREDVLPFPRQAGSWYHWSKVHGSNNIMFACRLWGLRATDIMQGVVFGTRICDRPLPLELHTRLDCDEAFGTVVNRLCCQALIGQPLTVYGSGGQRRGFIPLSDATECIGRCLEQPAAEGEYRVVNQFEAVHSVLEVAETVRNAAREQGLPAEIAHIDNPRVEAEQHYYKPERRKLIELGYSPRPDMPRWIRTMLDDLAPHCRRIRPGVLRPRIRWQRTARAAVGLGAPQGVIDLDAAPRS